MIEVGGTCNVKKLSKKFIRKVVSCGMSSKKVNITLENWDYECGDGCCYNYGVEISLNGKKSDNQYAGDDVEQALKFVLAELGYDVEIEIT